MSTEETIVYLDHEELCHGKCKHSFGGVLRPTWSSSNSLVSITCNGCKDFVRFSPEGGFVASEGDVLDLAYKVTAKGTA